MKTLTGKAEELSKHVTFNIEDYFYRKCNAFMNGSNQNFTILSIKFNNKDACLLTHVCVLSSGHKHRSIESRLPKKGAIQI